MSTAAEPTELPGPGEELFHEHEEYEREPVPRKAWLGLGNFVGMYAGEHVAGTELMIGPLFVAAGVSAVDLIFGLLLGNTFAVLSWVLFTGPIATRARLTLYYQLEKICGRKLVILYNLANGLMFCFLAGAMITVSATALGVWFRYPMPKLDALYPDSVGWVVAVFVIGALISVIAAYGYKSVARFASIAAPWMVMVFLAFGIIGLKQLADGGVPRANGNSAPVTSLAELWQLAQTVIWKGGDPLPGQTKFTFWHVTFFAWFCNMAMHIGMADLSVLRYARKSWYGVASASGMFIGHFMAWISASLLYAVQLRQDPSNTDVLPGPMANNAAGLAGLLCVIFAGWTTANPTIYRAGLAFQAVIPKSSRYLVTLATGMVATIAGMFPAIAMKMLGFVALYGLVLMPMGAVIFVDFWLSRRFGFENNYAERTGSSFNLAAALAWFLTLAICLALVLFGGIELYFVSLPGWFVAAIIYIASSKLIQRGLANRVPLAQSAP